LGEALESLRVHRVVPACLGLGELRDIGCDDSRCEGIDVGDEDVEALADEAANLLDEFVVTWSVARIGRSRRELYFQKGSSWFFLCKCGGHFCYRGSDGREKGRSHTYICIWGSGIWLQPHLGLKHLVYRGQIRRTRIEWPRWAKAGRLNGRRGVSPTVRHRS
jgi:hypothetical protein